jgi:hypothetical protein
MATYKATMDVYLSGEGRFINAGNTFSSDCIPGSTWDPLDDDAKAAVEERDGVRDPDSLLPPSLPRPPGAVARIPPPSLPRPPMAMRRRPALHRTLIP